MADFKIGKVTHYYVVGLKVTKEIKEGAEVFKQ